jgi:hypothetical protein
MKQGLMAGMALCSALVLAPMVTGCCKKPGSSSSSGSGMSGSTGGGVTGELVTIPEAGLKFNAPGGWTRYPAGRWVRFKPADNGARLAFVTFDRPGESTALIGQISQNLDITSLDWRSVSQGTIGPNALPTPVTGETPPGKCKLASTGEDCYAWYTTVNPGRSTQLLIVYTVVTAKSAVHKANAQAAIRSLSKL